MANKLAASAAKKFIDVVPEFYHALKLPDVGARRGFETVVGQSPFMGSINKAAVNADFHGPQRLWKALTSEAESTLGVIPSREAFKNRIIPFLQRDRDAMTKLNKGDLNRIASRVSVPSSVDERLKAAGLVVPGSSAGTPLSLLAKQTDKGLSTKLDIDAQVVMLVKQGRFEEAADVLYDQVENIARLTPSSLVDAARARNGENIFYDIRSARNKTWSEMLGIPQRPLGRGTSIGSANAGPAQEETRMLSLLPFLRTKNGRVVFDRDKAIKVLGEAPFAGKSSNADQIANAMVKLLNDPQDWASTGASGLSNKTWVYDIMEADPKNPLVIVADNVGATARGGISSAQLPNTFEQSIYGQIPERVVADALGIQPSALQEIDWLSSRLLRSPDGSIAPFSHTPTMDEMEQIAAGKILVPPNAKKPTMPQMEELGERLQREVISKRPGGLVAQDVQDLANEKAAAAKYTGDLVTETGAPNPASFDVIVEPSVRTEANVARARDAIETIRGLRGSATPEVIASIVAAAGFASLGQLFATATAGSNNPSEEALAQMAGLR